MKQKFNIDAFFGTLESKKSEQGISWPELACELGISDPAVFGDMSRGQIPSVDILLTLGGWLGLPLEHFVADSRQDAPLSLALAMRGICDELDPATLASVMRGIQQAKDGDLHDSPKGFVE